MRSPTPIVALTTAVALSLGLVAPPAVCADDALTVVLKNGASYHGELVERVPGDHVTLRLATGDIKTFAWSEVASAPSSAASPPTSPVPDGGTWVHLRAPDAVLERALGSSETASGHADHFELVCAAPCDRVVPRGVYRVAKGARGSQTFVLDGARREVTASFSTTSGTILGSLLLGVGASGLGVGLAGFAEPKGTVDRTVLYAVVGTAAFATLLGIVALASNRTTVRVGAPDAVGFDVRRGAWTF